MTPKNKYNTTYYLDMTMEQTESTLADHLGMAAFFLFMPAAVFIGPLEAAIGIAVYWFFEPDRSPAETSPAE